MSDTPCANAMRIYRRTRGRLLGQRGSYNEYIADGQPVRSVVFEEIGSSDETSRIDQIVNEIDPADEGAQHCSLANATPDRCVEFAFVSRRNDSSGRRRI